ncbi:MAG: hypothetical protein Q8844_01130 [Pigeon pea little leaf phytoplasma]|nr:hypothetical protein [Pigeon pea little leaf phytoplasma]MDV3188970.1 hypothetical protein [Pigeon pea little leaf phytoplasma]
MLGNLLVRFGWGGLFVIVDRKTNLINETQIIYICDMLIKHNI